jgi:hypothetical protein
VVFCAEWAEGFKCGEKEYRETRNNYERCATNKIRSPAML